MLAKIEILGWACQNFYVLGGEIKVRWIYFFHDAKIHEKVLYEKKLYNVK